MVALQNVVPNVGEDYGTSLFVVEQMQQRGPKRRPAIYTTLRIVIDANEGTVERHLEARDGAMREQFALSNRFESPAAAIGFYSALGFRVNKRASKGGRIVLEARAIHTQERTFNGREPDFTPPMLPQKRTNAPAANEPLTLKPLSRRATVCRVEGCEQPREAGSRRCLCLAHRQQDDKRRKAEHAAKKAGVK